jgi:acyl-CoA synthetase (NDP forming)
LKILHVAGPLRSNRIVSASCSGGEASLMADSALDRGVVFPPLAAAQQVALRRVLGPKVALANPLDYHTYIWGDEAALCACFAGLMAGENLGMGLVLLDFPREDRCSVADWDVVIEAVAAVAEQSDAPMAILSSLVETMPEQVAEALMARGIIPLCDVPAALEAIAAAAFLGRGHDPAPVLISPQSGSPRGVAQPDQPEMPSEAAAKQALADYGVSVPYLVRCDTAEATANAGVPFPVVLKGEGFAHKTEAGAVKLGLVSGAEVRAAAEAMGATGYIVEEMVTGAVAELLIGAVRDPVHGFVLTLGAGGIWTEILRDTVTRLLPITEDEIRAALADLRVAPLLRGYRGAPAANIEAVVAVVLAVQAYVASQAGMLEEVEINPLLCTPTRAVAVDALVRFRDDYEREGDGNAA